LKRCRRYLIQKDPWEVDPSRYQLVIEDTAPYRGGIHLLLRIVGDTVVAVSLSHYEV